MTQQFTIPQALPDLNTILDDAKIRAGNWSRYNDTKQKATKAAMIYAKQQKVRPITAADFEFEWHCRTARKDPDNVSVGAKFILDGLVKAGVMANDGWRQVRSIKHTFQKSDQDKVIITIRERHETDGSERVD